MAIISDTGVPYRANSANSLYLSGRSRFGAGSFLFFDTQAGTDPLTGSATRAVFVDSNDKLCYWNGTSTLRITASGSGTPTWEDLYANDATFALTSATWTITQSAAAAALTLNKTNVGAGTLLDLTNSGSGKDIANSTNWSIAASGGHGILELGSGGTINATDGAMTLGKSGTTTTFSGAVTMTAGAFVMTSGSQTITSGNLVLTLGNATLTAGNLVLTLGTYTQTYSTNANSWILTNNTATTIGAAASTGVMNVVSTSLTTGCLLNLELTEGTLNGGFYIRCWDATAGASNFQVAEDGATTILGGAASNMLTITAGDMVLSDGSITVTDADDAATVSCVNNTATSAAVYKFAGSGVFTGTGATSFFNITASGTTAGTAFTVIANAAATSVAVVDFSVTGLTSGSALRITSSTANFTTGGKMIELAMVAATAGNGLSIATTGAYTGTGLILASAGAMTTGILVSLVSTTGLTSGSLIRATSSTAGAIATNGAISFTATGDFTVGAVGLGFFHVGANTTTAGTAASISGTALTTGVALHIASTGTGITTGSLIRATTGTTGAVATNGVISIRATGAYTSTTNAALLDVAASASTDGTLVNLAMSAAAQVDSRILNVVASGYTTGFTGDVVKFTGCSTTGVGNVLNIVAVNTSAGGAVNIANNALTTGYGQRITHTTSVIASGGSLFRVSSTSVDTSTTTGTLVDLSSTSAAAATLVQLLDTGLTTGAGVFVSHTTSVLASGGSLVRIKSTSVDTGTTTGVLLDLAATAATTANLAVITSATLTTGTGVVMTLNGLTTGSGLSISSSSTDNGTRGLIVLNQTGAGATGTSMIRMNQVVTSTNFRKLITETNTGITIWMSNNTDPNGALTGAAGDICFNGSSHKPAYNTDGSTTWVNLV